MVIGSCIVSYISQPISIKRRPKEMSAKASEEILDSWATLRLAAAQVEEEDQLEGSMGLLQAADEVAAILNLPSPLRNKKQPERVPDRLNSTNDNMMDRTTHSLSLSESQVQTTLIHSDADHFLRDMKIEPNPIVSNSVAFEDVDALLKIERKKNHSEDDLHCYSPRVDHSIYRDSHHTATRKEHRHNSHNDTHNNRSQRVRDHYLQRLLHKTRSSQQSRGGSSSAFQGDNHQQQSIARSAASLNSQPSRLSLRLQQLSADRQTRLCRTDVQRYLLASMQVLSSSSQHSNRSNDGHRNSNTPPNVQNLIRPRTQLLAQSRNAFNHNHTKRHRNEDREQQFLLYEEAKECVFEPNHHYREVERRRQKRQGHSDDEENEKNARTDKDAVFFAFLSRQDGEERKRRDELKYMQKMLDYDARIDKKVCPSCGAVQSYDEVREKRKQCPPCQVHYVSPLCWSQVARQFLKRAKDHQHKKDANLTQLAHDIFAAERGQDTSHKVCDVELFLQRLAEAADRRTQRLAAIEREVYKVATFQPNINRASAVDKKTNDEEDDMEDELNSVLSADPVRDFLLRYEEDIEDRRRRMPQKYRCKEAHADNAEPKRPQSPPQRFRF